MAEIVIDGDVYEVGELRLEKCLRLVDAIAALQRSSQVATEMVADWTERETERRRQQTEDPQLRELRRGAIAQVVREEMPELEGDEIDEAVERRLNDTAPSWMERMLRLVPYVWKDARGELDTLLAVAIAPISEMETADAQGVLDQYLASKSRMIRYHGTLSTARAILVALADRITEEMANEGTLGEVVGGFREALGGMLSVVTSSPVSAAPGSTDSPATTGGAAETSSTAPPSPSSPRSPA